MHAAMDGRLSKQYAPIPAFYCGVLSKGGIADVTLAVSCWLLNIHAACRHCSAETSSAEAVHPCFSCAEGSERRRPAAAAAAAPPGAALQRPNAAVQPACAAAGGQPDRGGGRRDAQHAAWRRQHDRDAGGADAPPPAADATARAATHPTGRRWVCLLHSQLCPANAGLQRCCAMHAERLFGEPRHCPHAAAMVALGIVTRTQTLNFRSGGPGGRGVCGGGGAGGGGSGAQLPAAPARHCAR